MAIAPSSPGSCSILKYNPLKYCLNSLLLIRFALPASNILFLKKALFKVRYIPGAKRSLTTRNEASF